MLLSAGGRARGGARDGGVCAGSASALTEEESAASSPRFPTRLSAVETMNGEFVQFNPDGEQLQGKFFIARPGQVRFQYDPPTTVSVIADGKSVLVFDKKLQTYDIWPLSQTPLRLLLDKSLDLATSDKVTRVGVAPDLVEVELQDETALQRRHAQPHLRPHDLRAPAMDGDRPAGPADHGRALQRRDRQAARRPTSSRSTTTPPPTPPARTRTVSCNLRHSSAAFGRIPRSAASAEALKTRLAASHVMRSGSGGSCEHAPRLVGARPHRFR